MNLNPHVLENAERQAAIYRVLSNPRRLLILWLLTERAYTVSEIAQALETSLQNTSQHLRLMKTGGILVSHREGQMIYYSIADNTLARECLQLARVPPSGPQEHIQQPMNFEHSTQKGVTQHVHRHD